MATYSYESASVRYDTPLMQYVTLEDTYQGIDTMFDINPSALPSDTEWTWAELRRQETRGQYMHLNTSYLTSAFVQTPLSSSTSEWVQSKFQNMLIDSDAIEKTYNIDIITSQAEYVPYYTKISFPCGAFADFSNSIVDNNFSSKFIKTLYEVFSDKASS